MNTKNILRLIEDGNIKKILIIRLSSLGDVLLTTPLIRSLKNQFPELIFHFVVKKNYKNTLVNNPYLDRIFIYEKDKLAELKSNLAENKYDLIIDLQNNFRSFLITLKLKTKKTFFNKRTISKFLLVKFKINKLKEAPPIPERYAESIPGLKLDNDGLDLFTKEQPPTEIIGRNNLIGFCPGSRHFTKMWLKEYYIELGNILTEAGHQIVLFGGRSDMEICSELREKIPNSISLCNDDDILQTAADMKLCRLIVCNDSGLMHTACAVKTPVITFFGSTVREFGFAPYKNKNLILENKSLSCRPCSHIGRSSCPKDHFKCMLELKPGIVYKHIVDLLDS